MPCDDRARNWSDAAVSCRTPRAAGSEPEQEEEGNILPYSLQREQGPASRLLVSRTVSKQMFVSLSHLVHGHLSWQPWDSDNTQQLQPQGKQASMTFPPLWMDKQRLGEVPQGHINQRSGQPGSAKFLGGRGISNRLKSKD